MKEAVRTEDEFALDYFLKTRTASEIGRRVTQLVRLLKGKAPRIKRKGSASELSKFDEKENGNGSSSKRNKIN